MESIQYQQSLVWAEIGARPSVSTNGWDRASTHFAVQVEQVEREQTDADLDVLDLDILPFPSAQFLERKQLRSVLVDGHSLGVKYERLRTLFDALSGMRSATPLRR